MTMGAVLHAVEVAVIALGVCFPIGIVAALAVMSLLRRRVRAGRQDQDCSDYTRERWRDHQHDWRGGDREY